MKQINGKKNQLTEMLTSEKDLLFEYIVTLRDVFKNSFHRNKIFQSYLDLMDEIFCTSCEHLYKKII